MTLTLLKMSLKRYLGSVIQQNNQGLIQKNNMGASIFESVTGQV